jgi:hypothetical protein
MRFDGIEIKVTLGRDQTESAVQKLNLPSGRPRWQIYFCEDVAAGISPGTPLLDGGVILRARDKPGGKDDATVKLRPCRRSQLTDRWLAATEGETDDGDKWEFKLEADWSGDRRVLTASHTTGRPEGVVTGVGRKRGSVEDLFVAEQLAFLRDCAGVAINLGTLTILPPVTATRWKSVEKAPPELEVRAERWTVGDLDFLELSVVANLDGAWTKQEALTGFVHSLDLVADPDQESKTRQVLEYLVKRAAEPP